MPSTRDRLRGQGRSYAPPVREMSDSERERMIEKAKAAQAKQAPKKAAK